MNTSDVLVIGGGLVGSSVALGMQRCGRQVTVIDEGDIAFRASRGNFGLVWVQGKGYGLHEYAAWSLASSRRWPQLAAYLQESTGIDVGLQQAGGLHMCLSDEELQTRRERLQWLRDRVGDDYQYEILDASDLRARVPSAGPEVVGATYTPMDGHANPLRLLRALHAACGNEGVVRHAGVGTVQSITRANGMFTVTAGGQRWQAPKVVLAAGLGNKQLAPLVGLHAPVEPNKGEVLISERLRHFLDHPTNYVRQTDEGTVQIGDSHEDVGYDDSTVTQVLGHIAARGVRCFPILRHASLVRAWAALRVLTPDGFPIYQESATQPGAFVVTCHSGVTLAANHVLRIAPWLAGDDAVPPEVAPFEGDRFLHSSQSVSHGH